MGARPRLAMDEILDEFRRLGASLKPPRFDRAAVSNIEDLRKALKVPPPDRPVYVNSLRDVFALPPARLLGVPVYIDGDLEPGVLELRKGDEVVASCAFSV